MKIESHNTEPALPIVRSVKLYNKIERQFENEDDLQDEIEDFQELLDESLEYLPKNEASKLNVVAFRFLENIEWDKTNKLIKIFGSGLPDWGGLKSYDSFAIQGI